MRITPMTLAGALLPPALVSYFVWAFRRLSSVVLPRIWTSSRPLGLAFAISVRLIPVIGILFLRLYLLPRGQSVPPPESPVDHCLGELAREPDGPVRVSTLRALGLDAGQLHRLAGERARILGRYLDADAGDLGGVNQDVLVLPEWCGRCSRTRPARTRHCGECGVCRMGFDHHCAFFGNCLTAPYLSCFLALLLLTPVVVLLLSIPMYRPLYARALRAYALAPEWWWSTWWSWVCGGPLGRWLGGIALGWRTLDRLDPVEDETLEIAGIYFIGQILALMTLALAYATASALYRGQFTVDLARAKSFRRDPERFAPLTRFYVPLLPSPAPSPPLTTVLPRASPLETHTNGTSIFEAAMNGTAKPQQIEQEYEPPGYDSYGNEVAGVLVTLRDMSLYDTPGTWRWVLRGKARVWRVLRSEWTPAELAHWPIRRDVLRDVQRQKERWLQ